MWIMWPSMAIGIWIIVAPAVLGYVGQSGAANDRIIGPFIAMFSIVALGEATRGVRYANVPLGLWMVIAAFFLDYPAAGVVNAILCGLATMVIPLKPRPHITPYGGGWGVLLRKDPYDVRHGSVDRPANPDGTGA